MGEITLNLSKRRHRRTLKRRRIIKGRLNVFGSKSLPIVFTKKVEKKIEKKPELKKKWYQKFWDFLKNLFQ